MVTYANGTQLLSTTISSTFQDVQTLLPCNLYLIAVSSLNMFLVPGEPKQVNYTANGKWATGYDGYHAQCKNVGMWIIACVWWVHLYISFCLSQIYLQCQKFWRITAVWVRLPWYHGELCSVLSLTVPQQLIRMVGPCPALPRAQHACWPNWVVAGTTWCGSVPLPKTVRAQAASLPSSKQVSDDHWFKIRTVQLDHIAVYGDGWPSLINTKLFRNPDVNLDEK